MYLLRNCPSTRKPITMCQRMHPKVRHACGNSLILSRNFTYIARRDAAKARGSDSGSDCPNPKDNYSLGISCEKNETLATLALASGSGFSLLPSSFRWDSFFLHDILQDVIVRGIGTVRPTLTVPESDCQSRPSGFGPIASSDVCMETARQNQ